MDDNKVFNKINFVSIRTWYIYPRKCDIILHKFKMLYNQNHKLIKSKLSYDIKWVKNVNINDNDKCQKLFIKIDKNHTIESKSYIMETEGKNELSHSHI